MSTQHRIRRSSWLLYLVAFVALAGVAELLRADDLAIMIMILSSGCSAIVAGARTIDMRRVRIAAPLAIGIAVTGATQALAWVFPHGPGASLVLQLIVLIGHVSVGYGVMEWARMRALSSRSPWLVPAVASMVVPVVWAVAAVLLGTGWSALTDVRVASALRLAVDASVLVIVVQASAVGARRNGAFKLLRYGFAAQVGSAVVLATSIWHGFGIPLLFRGLTIVAMALFGAAALHPGFRGERATATVAVQGRAYRVIETATLALAIAVAPGFAAGDDNAFEVLRLLAAMLLVALILTWSDRALRDLEARASDARYRSMHDQLTGLPNWVLMVEDMEAARGSGSIGRQADGAADAALILVKIDGLRTVIGCYGHAAGDELLRAVALRIRLTLGDSGRLYRHDFDVFAVRVDCAADRAMEFAERTVNELSDTLPIGGINLGFSVRAGVASLGNRLLTPQELIREADSAVESAGRGGVRSVVEFDDRQRAEAIRRWEVSARLREGLQAGEFELHYQPIVHARSGTVAAYEALLRWRDGDTIRGPEFFMDIAEDSGMIVDIGEWVFDTAARAAAEWGATRAVRTPVTVNVSARQLLDARLADRLARALDRHGLAPEAMWVELTETALIADTANAARVLSELAELGITICLDDFGVGYSALYHLSMFPISVVKIDKSFVSVLRARASGGEETRKRRVVVRNIVTMAQQLGLSTVAEGVEDAELDEQVAALGCTYAQGWYHGRPLARVDTGAPDHM
ncbi:bifunctional diguanylate cyclase/phosphodiesterase [Tsukamurella sp. 8F]|uniref:putative bifunctional diguanylate cyclase/phosphodiesterase n=1 Tax=unclassified Tsukamurella TaxID=2633480 RepID=UPI0023B9DA94|nr:MULTISPECIES: bifunctional diguanylate cyclase/phosphodiesterase [unclassified Tsukamurella]MDF0531263.1 bifunctional diguanylate cyclase/phosphodiesterase [Tsukamurella sp. 8J]MDF0585212.1 bifunctional diguanylate cyclase/phosphodiesterase [Tsukamurella sp. 8F]